MKQLLKPKDKKKPEVLNVGGGKPVKLQKI